jgi:RNA polymerase sigma-70 factor (ECF subfamily)
MFGDLTEAELLGRLEQAVRRMPERRRKIFLAIRQEGASYSELAERHGLTTLQVERELARALLELDDAVSGRRRVPWWRGWLRWIAGRSDT